jgi:hypothetical protein
MSDGYEKFVRGVHALLLIAGALLAGLCIRVAWDAHRALAGLPATVTDLRRVVLVAGGAATDLEKTLRDERAASADQIRQASLSAVKLNTALDRASTFLDTLNGTGQLLGQAVTDQDQALLALEKQATADLVTLDDASRQLNAALGNTAAASKSAADLLADPAIGESIARLDGAMAKADETLAHLDSAAASGDRQMAMLEVRLRQALKPASLLRQLLTGAANWTVKGAQFYGATR